MQDELKRWEKTWGFVFFLDPFDAEFLFDCTQNRICDYHMMILEVMVDKEKSEEEKNNIH